MLASAGYLLTMLGDCVVLFVIANSKKDAKVLELEGGTTPQEPHHVVDTTNPMLLKTSSVGDTILLILALCFHSVFEGIAVGVSGIYSLPHLNNYFHFKLLHVSCGLS